MDIHERTMRAMLIHYEAEKKRIEELEETRDLTLEETQYYSAIAQKIEDYLGVISTFDDEMAKGDQ